MEGDVLDKASRLHLSSISLAENMRSGSFRSINRGQGIEFSDVRDYLIGDNVRSIDWNVTARMGRPFIKQYEEDRELNCFVILDFSLSMHSGSSKKTRMDTAIDCASLLIMASEHNGGANGAVFFDGEIKFSYPPESGRSNSLMILSKIDKFDFNSISAGSALPNAIKGAAKLLRRRSLVFVISDFRAAGWENDLAYLSSKNDVVAIRITDPVDSELPKIGTLPFKDSETGIVRVLPTNSKSFRKAWFDANRQRVDNWEDFCIKHGASPLSISTMEDPYLSLMRFFSIHKRK